MKNVFKAALEAEITGHLGHEKHGPAESGNVRNGIRSTTVFTEVGPVEIDVPRDREGNFGAADRKKCQRRLDGINEVVLSLTARGLTAGEVAAPFVDVYGATVSEGTISGPARRS
jgi:putative transposase